MKKRFFVGSMLGFGLLLAACQEDTARPEAPSEEKVQQQTDDYRQDYAHVLSRYMEDYGMLGYAPVEFFDEYNIGLLHAELLDFNQDGFDELYIVYKDADYKGGINGYVQEVWSTTDAAQPAKQLVKKQLQFHEEYEADIVPNGIGYVTLADGQIALRETAMDLIGQMPHEDHALFTLQNGQFELYERYTLNALDNWTYEKSGSEITEEEYETSLDALATNTTWIIEDSLGPDLIYPMNMVEEMNELNTLQQQLTDTLQAELVAVASVFAQADEQQLQAILEKYSYLRKLDMTKDTARSLAVYYIFTNQLKSTQNEEYLLVYDVAQIIEKAKDEFGVALVANDFDVMNTPPNESLYYEEGQIVSSIFDGFSFEEQNELKRAKLLRDGVYYVEYENISIDIYGDFLTEQDLQTPITQWSSDKLQAVTNHGLQYVVVNLEEGNLLYKSSKPLYEDELAKF